MVGMVVNCLGDVRARMADNLRDNFRSPSAFPQMSDKGVAKVVPAAKRLLRFDTDGRPLSGRRNKRLRAQGPSLRAIERRLGISEGSVRVFESWNEGLILKGAIPRAIARTSSYWVQVFWRRRRSTHG